MLKEYLNYDSDTGQFTWKVRPRHNSPILPGTIAGNNNGEYIRIGINKKYYSAARLAWLYMYGSFPSETIDHINGNKKDNRISNLRECSQAENNQNYAAFKCNKTGLIGAHWHKARNKWKSSIGVDGKNIYLGMFDTAQEAHKAYCDAKQKIHKFQSIPR